ncbi:MAG: NADH-quinone oxidoreductase subunit A [Deltaproteobacteria bacterium]|nr:NADH-quinone oxidoreductase subunit A [Deltaproteobacteria bacterium]
MSMGAFLLYLCGSVALVAAMLALSWLLGGRHRERTTGEPYESGIAPTGGPHAPISIQYTLIAMAFVVFDVEAAFVLAWAAVARPAGWVGWIEMLVFLGVLGAALAYLWREGALDWGTTALLRQRRLALEQARKTQRRAKLEEPDRPWPQIQPTPLPRGGTGG